MRAILTYHSIDASGSPISCHPEAFDRHVRWLTSGRVTVTSIDVLIRLPEWADAVALTFDDAFANFAELAAPKLLGAGLACTLFVVSDAAGRTNAWGGRHERGIPELRLLDWSELLRLQEQGVALGSHSRTHPDLTALDPSRLEDEVVGSADVIARETGRRPSTFCYPYGRVDELSAAVVSRTFRYACMTEFRALPDDVAVARLPRLDAFYFERPGLLETWGTPSFSRFVRRRRQLRRIRRAVITPAKRLVSWRH